MRVFVTGASGFVGSAVVAELLAAGHRVLGLARNDTAAAALKALGAQVQRGALEDLNSLRRDAEQSDGVIHTAFIHDFGQFAASCTRDREAIAAIGQALAGSERLLLTTSGVAHLAAGRRADEHDAAPVPSSGFPRASEAATAELAATGVRASVIRLPPSVHGLGDHGFVPLLADIARAKGVSAYIGDGGNR